jgi:hypothetical protein
MAGVVGSSYFDCYLFSHKLLSPNSSFQYDLFSMPLLNWMVKEIRHHLSMISHELLERAYRSLIELLSRDWHSDSNCSNSLDGNRLTQSILNYCSLAAQTFKLLTIYITLNQKRCEFEPIQGSVPYWWSGVSGHQQRRLKEAFFWGLLSEAAAW